MTYNDFFKVEEDEGDEKLKHDKNYFLEMIWDIPKVDMRTVSDASLIDQIVENIDSFEFCDDISAWGINPVSVVEGVLNEDEYIVFNKFVDFNVKHGMSIIEILCRVVECSKIECTDDDFVKMVRSINEKNMDLLRLEKAVRNGNRREIDNTATNFFL